MSGCWAPADDPLLSAYHDAEWGRPVLDDGGLFERLCLEGFQSGLSWRTVLVKRPAFREVFVGFEPGALASFGTDDGERLMAEAPTIRNPRKNGAVLTNARAMLPLDVGLAELVWSYEPEARPAPTTLAELPPTLP